MTYTIVDNGVEREMTLEEQEQYLAAAYPQEENEDGPTES